MSHVTSQTLDLKDLGCLAEACEALGLEIRPKTTYKWWGHHVGDYPIPEGFTVADLGKCEFAIGVKGDTEAFEIGAVRRAGQWHLLYDFYGHRGQALLARTGEGLAKLKTQYGVQVVKKAGLKLTAMGYKLQVKTLPTGQVKMEYVR